MKKRCMPITPRNMKYPPKASPSYTAMNKSWNFIVNNPRFKSGKSKHRRNISSGYCPHHLTANTARREKASENRHESWMQLNKSPIHRLDIDEASNFNDEEIDEAQSQCIVKDELSEKDRNIDPAVYSAKYSYKSYLEQQSNI